MIAFSKLRERQRIWERRGGRIEGRGGRGKDLGGRGEREVGREKRVKMGEH